MFKKSLVLGTANKVSKADRKKVARGLQEKYGITNEDLEAVMPTKDGDVEAVKVSPPNRAVVYLVNATPVVVDASGKGDYFPTVFALWRATEMLPRIYLKHPEVSQFIVKGADLMIPGVAMPAGGLPAFQEGSLVSICIHGNPAPVGVGLATMSNTDVLSKTQGKGRLVELLQHYGDCLWSEIGQSMIPNTGFKPGVVLAIDNAAPQVPAAAEDVHAAAAAVDTASLADAAASTQSLAELHISGEEPESKFVDDTAQPNTNTHPDMESLLELCLLQALHKDVKDKDLPLNSTVLWKSMLAGRPSGVVLDVKKTKHKKLSKWLQAYTKAGLIGTKEDKHSGDAILVRVNRSHQLYEEHVPYKVASTPDNVSGADDRQQGAQSSGALSSSSQVRVEEVLKASKELKPIFEAVGCRFEAFYTHNEAFDVVLAYVQHARLEENAPNNATIMLDPTLCDALFKGVVNVKKGETYPTFLPKSDLRDAWGRRFQQQCMVSRGDKQVVKKGQPAVNVSVQKRQGSKKVTCLDGVESFLVDAEEIAQACQKLFAASATVNELPGKKQAGCEVVIQGSVADKLAAHLEGAYGIPKKYINVKK